MDFLIFNTTKDMVNIEILENDPVYMVNRTIGNVIVLVLLVLILLLVGLFLYANKRMRSERKALEKNQELIENYNELEQAFEDITVSNQQLTSKYEELKKNQELIKKLAYTDQLTGLPNRLAFSDVLDGVMLTLRNEEVIALMVIDLDNFKIINDTLGHSYGDELLIDVTHRLKQAMDENDFLARMGGDEFCVLTQNFEDVGLYEEKIKKIQKVFSYPFVLAMKEFFVTVSIGITFAPKDGKTTQALIKNMDSAMYAAKDSGKNTYSYFNDSMKAKLMEKIQLQSELRKAIENEEFVVYYQPQVDLKTDKIVGFEALLRWMHPAKGLIMPNEFIPIAEETGLIVQIGTRVLKEACKQLKFWEEEGFHKLSIAVNISARQFKDLEFVNTIEAILEETNMQPNHLDLEITETIALSDLEYTVKTIDKLEKMGVSFSLDDFGTGYSSMNYLKSLPVHNIKIDKSFLDTVVDNIPEQKIVETIISLAHSLNLVVIAEGVEQHKQEIFLKSVNCNKAQGYFYSEPVPKEEAGSILRNINLM
nr:EAL domain-containing protein [uncultured Anaerocolumna sp.]